MGKIKRYLGEIAAKTLLGIGGLFLLNAGMNKYYSAEIGKNNASLKKMSEFLINYRADDNVKYASSISKEDADGGFFRFSHNSWRMLNTQKHLIAQLENDMLFESMKINLGIATEEDSIPPSEISQARTLLSKKGIILNDVQNIKVKLPNQYDSNELIPAIRNSFQNEPEFCIILTNNDYKAPSKNISVISEPTQRTVLADKGFDRNNLDKLIFNEVLRYVAGEGSNMDDFKDYDASKVTSKKIRDKISPLKMPKYNLTINKDSLRVLTINAGLDDVSESDAENIINSASKKFREEFGIEFRVNEMHENTLPKNWDTITEINKIKNMSKKKSDVYLIVTSNNWNTGEEESMFLSTSGQAYPDYGYIWIETPNMVTATDVLLHEITHIFGVGHDYNLESIMKPVYSSGELMWTNYHKSIVLKNKFKKWN